MWSPILISFCLSEEINEVWIPKLKFLFFICARDLRGSLVTCPDPWFHGDHLTSLAGSSNYEHQTIKSKACPRLLLKWRNAFNNDVSSELLTKVFVCKLLWVFIVLCTSLLDLVCKNVIYHQSKRGQEQLFRGTSRGKAVPARASTGGITF